MTEQQALIIIEELQSIKSLTIGITLCIGLILLLKIIFNYLEKN